MLMGQPQVPDPQQVGNVPLAQRLALPLGPPQQQPPPPQPQQPTPQQAEAARHQALGKVTSLLFGHVTDPNTGEPVPQKPGAIFRSLLAGALLGGAMGSEGPRAGSGVGGFLTGFSRGGNAVRQQTYQRQLQGREEQRKQQAESREQQAFDTEQTHRQAMIAAENMQTIRTQQLIKGGTWDQFQREAENGKAKAQPYIESGIQADIRDKTWQEVQAIAAANPKAVGLDWEQTGVKAVINRDGTTSYEPTFDAYNPNRTVTLTQGFIDLMKKAKIDDTYPGTTDPLYAGQTLKPVEFSALKGLYQKAYNDQLARQQAGLATEKTKAEINDYNAQAIERAAKAARDAKADKQSQLLSSGLDEWSSTFASAHCSNSTEDHH